MADFCKECSELLFGTDFGDLKGPPFRTEEMIKEDKYYVWLCEGCGGILVDDDGKCIEHTTKQHEDMILRGIYD